MKVQKTIRVTQETLDKIDFIAKSEYEGNFSVALENMVKNSFAVMSVSEDERDQLRVSCRRGSFADIYDKHERVMIDFFWV